MVAGGCITVSASYKGVIQNLKYCLDIQRHGIMRKQCLCKFNVFGVKFKNVPEFYIENAQKGQCKAKRPKIACVNDEQ